MSMTDYSLSGTVPLSFFLYRPIQTSQKHPLSCGQSSPPVPMSLSLAQEKTQISTIIMKSVVDYTSHDLALFCINSGRWSLAGGSRVLEGSH